MDSFHQCIISVSGSRVHKHWTRFFRRNLFHLSCSHKNDQNDYSIDDFVFGTDHIVWGHYGPHPQLSTKSVNFMLLESPVKLISAVYYICVRISRDNLVHFFPQIDFHDFILHTKMSTTDSDKTDRLRKGNCLWKYWSRKIQIRKLN